MKFNYIGTEDPSDDAVCTVFGLTFTKGSPLDVEDAATVAKLKVNPTFQAATAKAHAKSSD